MTLTTMHSSLPGSLARLCHTLVRSQKVKTKCWRTPERTYYLVHKDGENGYNETRIEHRFTAMSPGGKIDLRLDNDVAVVTMNNPSKKNAFTGNMIIALRNVVKQLWDWKNGKAVVLTGFNGTFCSGLDLSLAKQLTSPEDGRDMCMYMQNTLTLFQFLPMITVAAIKGDALGGGAEVATATDFRIMFPESRIQFVHKRMGIIPGWGGVTRLCGIVGSRKTMHLLASSEALDSKSALLTGLVDALASDGDLTVDCVTKEWLHRTFKLDETDSSVFRAIKTATKHSPWDGDRPPGLVAGLRRERDILESVWGGTANRKALDQIKGKRQHAPNLHVQRNSEVI